MGCEGWTRVNVWCTPAYASAEVLLHRCPVVRVPALDQVRALPYRQDGMIEGQDGPLLPRKIEASDGVESLFPIRGAPRLNDSPIRNERRVM